MKRPKPLALLILDGWGIANDDSTNAITAANTPNIDKLQKEYPYAELETSGLAVGLPPGQMGNSEVGHLNIGAGRIIFQELTKIIKSIEDNSFYSNPVLLQAFDSAKKQNTNVHFMGLLSDGGVHSHIDHIYALLKLAKKKGFNPILHLFLDGRDVPPQSAKTYIDQLESKITEIGCGRIGSIMGRYWAMDRDNRWSRVKEAYNAMTGSGSVKAKSAKEAIKNAYSRGETDEFVKPTVISSTDQDGVGYLSPNLDTRTVPNRIHDNDSIVFFNFRPDRAREITRAFIDPDFNEFNRDPHPKHIFFTTFTEYDEDFNCNVAFKPTRPNKILADIMEENNLKQLRIAETEKYAHVTFFFDGGEETVRKGVDQILIPSPLVETYDTIPEMSANEVRLRATEEIKKNKYDVIILNFANADMVGHTGIFKAAVKAVEAVDNNVGKIVQSILDNDGIALITADHGNAEKMLDATTDKPFTAHTNSKVPFMVISNNDEFKNKRLRNGILADIAPTILDILKIEQPKEMTGKSLIKKE